MSTVLVTGATGTVGSKVVQELASRGQAVRAFARDPGPPAAGVEVAAGDFAKPDTVEVALKGVDRVFLASPNDPRQAEWETNVIDAAVAAGVARVVKLSAIGAQVGSPLEFWDAHGRVEEHLRRSGVPAVVLRPSFFASNLLASAEAIRHAGRFFLPARGARVAVVDPRDVAAVAATVLGREGDDGRTYRVTGPEVLTFGEVAEQLSGALGRPVAFVDVPDDAAREAMVESGVPSWFADNLVTLFALLRAGGAAEATDDVREVTGREPRSVADFARDHASLF